MKRIYIFCMFLCALAFLAVSCSDITGGGKPGVKLLLESNQILVPGESGTFSFNYRVTNPVKGGEIEVVIPEGTEWVKLESLDIHDDAYGMVVLSLVENIEGDHRNVVVSVNYNYDGSTASEIFNLIQDNIQLECMMEAKYGRCAYNSDRYGYFNHHIYLAETDLSQEVEQYFKLDLYTKEDSEDMMPLPGVYVMVDNQYTWDTDFSIDRALSSIRLLDEDGKGYTVMIETGELTVEKDGSVYNIHGEFFDKDGKCYRVSFVNGEFSVIDTSHDSTIPDDIEETYTDMVMKAYHVGDMELPGTNMWFLDIAPADMEAGDQIIQLSLAYELDVENKIEPGVFLPEYKLSPGTFLPGYFGAGYYGSWLFTCSGQQSDGRFEIGNPMAPFIDGVIEMKENADGTFDVIVDVVDDNEHTIKVTCTDVPVEYVTE